MSVSRCKVLVKSKYNAVPLLIQLIFYWGCLMKRLQEKFFVLSVALGISTLLMGCSENGNAVLPTGAKALNSLLQSADTACTSSNCQSGLYLVTTAAELGKINKGLLAQDQSTDQWSNNHYALLVTPGTYIEDSANIFELGYYTQVLGVGENINDVVINPGVQVHNQCGPLKGAPLSFQTDFQHNPLCQTIGGLNNFWRGIENFAMDLSGLSKVNPAQTSLIFAVSQASPIRNIHVTGVPAPLTANGLLLCDYHAPDFACGYTSGGFMANSIIDGKFNPGSQQQWLARNSNIDNAGTAVWNSVFVGNHFGTVPTTGAPSFTYRAPAGNNWTNAPLSINPNTALIAEKPYLICDNCSTATDLEDLSWHMKVPALRTAAEGIDTAVGKRLPLDNKFYILSPNSGPTANGVTKLTRQKTAEINQFLATAGHHLIIAPGVYELNGGSIQIAQANTVVLGLGLPALVCNAGDPCINITAPKGVRLAGILLDAGYSLTDNLLLVGTQKDSQDNSANPIILSDMFFRIAETQLEERVPGQERQTVAAATIYTNNVIGDNLWLWRADHDKASSHSMDAIANLVNWDQDRAEYGLIVYGDQVSIYGLAVEHFRQNQTVWYGENGRVTFYQSEMPYDILSLDEWICKDPRLGITSPSHGCASYVIGQNVKHHQGLGFGIYTYFANAPIVAPAAIQAPRTANITIDHIIGKWLNGQGAMTNLVTDSDPANRQCWGYGVDQTNQFSIMETFDNVVSSQPCIDSID